MAMEPVKRKWTVQEYLDYEIETGIKHEYIDGEIYAMSARRINHSLVNDEDHSVIVVNTSAMLWSQLKDKSCRVYDHEMRVQINKDRCVYADVSVVCGQPKFADEQRTTLLNPTLVVEVMSSASQTYDVGAKADYYRSLDSLQTYILIDEKRADVRMYMRQTEGWLLREFQSIEAVLPLDAIGCTLPLSEIYRNVDVDVDA